MSHVIWITGLSAAGKTTLAKAVTAQLRVGGESAIMLDGDDLRDAFGLTQKAHTREARLDLAFQYCRLARMIARQGVTVVVGTVALFKEVHEWNRRHLPGYFEVYLQVPLAELRRRDPKGLYHRFDAGEIANVAGLDLPVDEPVSPHVKITYQDGLTVEKELELVLQKLDEHRSLGRVGSHRSATPSTFHES